MASQTAVLKQASRFNDKFERYISKGLDKAHLVLNAYTAVAAKMAHTIYAMVSTSEAYSLFYEEVSLGGTISI